MLPTRRRAMNQFVGSFGSKVFRLASVVIPTVAVVFTASVALRVDNKLDDGDMQGETKEPASVSHREMSIMCAELLFLSISLSL